MADDEPCAHTIPGYQILREIHRGAQGVVYQAIQRATQRKVAIKILSSGAYASARAKARFRREIRVLGQFRHPHIVSVHDSGSVDGSFFYVMDYISGSTLDSFMAEGERGIPETLEVFAKICEAVNAAHLRGITHRDLKPGNILVDGDGEPHIVDFGLAKAALEPMAGEGQTQIVSRTGEFTGSLPWASPEQALGNPAKIDIRTDVYSLGVVLYQMLTRTFPYAVAGNLRDVLDNILHAEPGRPRTLRREIDSDVETIVLKALAKDPDRRYQSAGELARDVRSYLAGEPIAAKRDSTLYVLGKKIRRHRAPIALTTAAVFVIVVFLGSLSFMRQKAAAAEHKATRVQMQFMDLVMQSIDPGVTKLRTINDLPEIVTQIDSEFSDYPLLQAQLFEKIGNVLKRLGAYGDARPHLEKALEIRQTHLTPPNPDIASSLHSLGALRWQTADYADAESLYRQALDMRREALGNEDVRVADTLHHLGSALRAQARYDEAADTYRLALDLRTRLLGETDPETAATRNELGICFMELGRYEDAELLARRAWTIVANAPPESLSGRERPQYYARAQTTLAAALVELGEYDEAEALLLDSLDRKREQLGDAHPDVAGSLYWLAKLRFRTGDLQSAEPLAREAIKIRKEKSPYLASSLALLGEILLAQGKPAEAEQKLLSAMDIFRTISPLGYWQTGHAASVLGSCLAALDRNSEAEPLLVEGATTLVESRGSTDPYAMTAMQRVAEYYEADGRPNLAGPYRKSLAAPNSE